MIASEQAPCARLKANSPTQRLRARAQAHDRGVGRAMRQLATRGLTVALTNDHFAAWIGI
eukprot:3615123-Pleurochrysis_carterae.AAC.2